MPFLGMHSIPDRAAELHQPGQPRDLQAEMPHTGKCSGPAHPAMGHAGPLPSRTHPGINTALLRQDVLVWAQSHAKLDLDLPGHS